MRKLQVLLVAVVVAGMVVPAGALGGSLTSDDATDVAASAAAITTAQPSNNSTVSVGVGQQLSTVIAASESDVGTEVEESSFEASFEGSGESEKAEAIAERADALRDRARDIREEYREATREYERGDITRSQYAQRIAVLNARAENLLSSYERLQSRAANVSGFELAASGLNRSALRASVADLDNVTGTGAAALLERFTGQREGEIEIERSDGLRIEVESEDGERSREFERPRDGDDAMVVEQSVALETARNVLSGQDGNWTLSKASVHADSGYYRFEFALRTNESTGEAKIRVDGSTGEVFHVEEEIEPVDDDERDEDDEGDEDDERDDERDEDEHEELALIISDGTPSPGAIVTVTALADGDPLANATVLLNDERIGETGPNGSIAVALPNGSAEVEVRQGDEDAELEFEFDDLDEDRERDDVFRDIETIAAYDNGTVSMSVAYNGTPVTNVSVYANGDQVGVTDADGSLTFTTDATDELELELVKGELEAELEYHIEGGSLVLESSAHEGDGDKRDDDKEDEEDEDDEEDREEDEEDEDDEDEGDSDDEEDEEDDQEDSDGNEDDEDEEDDDDSDDADEDDSN